MDESLVSWDKLQLSQNHLFIVIVWRYKSVSKLNSLKYLVQTILLMLPKPSKYIGNGSVYVAELWGVFEGLRLDFLSNKSQQWTWPTAAILIQDHKTNNL
jgi:hypothetical protein